MNQLRMQEVEKLLKNKKFDKLRCLLLERAEYWHQQYSDDDKVLFLSDGFALCARDIFVYSNNLSDEIDFIINKDKQNKLEEIVFNTFKNISDEFDKFNNITITSSSLISISFKYDPYILPLKEYINIKNLSFADWRNLLRRVLDKDKENIESTINDIFNDLRLCIEYEIFYHLNTMNIDDYKEINEKSYDTFSFICNYSIKKGEYYKYMEIVFNFIKEIENLAVLQKNCVEYLHLIKECRSNFKLNYSNLNRNIKTLLDFEESIIGKLSS